MLHAVEALRSEILAGISAIEENDATRFGQAVRRQEDLTAELGLLASSAEASAHLGNRVLEAMEALALLNERYAALLQHAAETTRLFAGLYGRAQHREKPDPCYAWSAGRAFGGEAWVV